MTPRKFAWMTRLALLLALGWMGGGFAAALDPATPAHSQAAATSSLPRGGIRADRLECLGQAITDLRQTFGARYPRGGDFLARLEQLKPILTGQGNDRRLPAQCTEEFEKLQREALLANPLLDFEALLVVKRKPQPVSYPFGNRRDNGEKPLWYSQGLGAEIGLPSNHECNSSLSREGFDNEIAILCPRTPDLPLRTLYRPGDGGYAGEMDLHWDADRLLFSRSDAAHWQVMELRVDGRGLRQVTQMPDDVDCYDACYLPGDRILFGSSAPIQAVPCWHGLRRITNLYLANADGSSARRLCYDQDHDLHPVVMPNGQVLFNRWDYTGINHVFLRQLMLMNPDGTGQRAIYGSNSWYPNALYFPRPLPGPGSQLISILSGYHGVHKMGQLVMLDLSRGWHEARGMVRRISGRGDLLKPVIKDDLVSRDWPKFLHPYPLSEKYFLVAALLDQKSDWGIYLADVFDNLVLLRQEPGYALLEPVPVLKRPAPPLIPDRVNLASTNATAYIHNLYSGPGLAGVPRDTIKQLRVVAYHFGYPNLAGPHLIGRGGPWEVMRILGTVPVEADGSAMFAVPANTPIAFHPLDAEGQAVQLMRSWFTAMPGEVASCIGCHESPKDVSCGQYALAQRQEPHPLQPWRGPARGFDFEREVQPLLDRHCVSCHSDTGGALPDLRPLAAFPNYRGLVPDETSLERFHPNMLRDTQGYVKYTPAYEALVPYVRRVGIEDDVSLLLPGEYRAENSELLQLLRKGHHGTRPDAEAYDRLITWIDLNAPCHGSWSDLYPVPGGMHERRIELARLTRGPSEDPEAVPVLSKQSRTPVPPVAVPKAQPVQVAGWPFDAAQARLRQEALGKTRQRVDLANGLSLEMARIPAGEWAMGSITGPEDELSPARVTIAKPFWMGVTEINNEQFRQFAPDFDPGYYAKRHARDDDKGLPLDSPQQPAVRVSWDQAMAFCRWLSQKTRLEFTLPTEAQWEWACRAGTAMSHYFGGNEDDFSPWANLADQSFAAGHRPDGSQVTGGVDHLLLDGASLASRKFNDCQRVTAPVGTYQPNAWGLQDMHGNAAEWTLTEYRPYPYREDDGRNLARAEGLKVVRGGSFYDRPARGTASYRLSYPYWQRVFNVGFRVVCVDAPKKTARK